MGGFGLTHWIILGVIVLVLFGKGRISDMMEDVGKGIKGFKKGIADEAAPTEQVKSITHIDGQPAPAQTVEQPVTASQPKVN